MRQIMIMIQVILLLVMAAGIASATELSLATASDADSGYLSAAKSVEMTLVAAPAAVRNPSIEAQNELPPELEPALLRERAFTEANAFAGVQIALPTSPLSIVLAADELLNPTCGLKLHLVW
ncbi:MAG: hypothetical protein K8R55_04955 [Desulfuromonadaceae bacterium]|nr:hypothetical protein [Desulfuromonadaceae bacterium]